MDFVSSTGPLDANKETSTNHGTITLHNVETGSMKNWPNLPMQSTEVNSTKWNPDVPKLVTHYNVILIVFSNTIQHMILFGISFVTILFSEIILRANCKNC